MYTKSMRVKDVNGNEVVIGGEEIFRAKMRRSRNY